MVSSAWHLAAHYPHGIVNSPGANDCSWSFHTSRWLVRRRATDVLPDLQVIWMARSWTYQLCCTFWSTALHDSWLFLRWPVYEWSLRLNGQSNFRGYWWSEYVAPPKSSVDSGDMPLVLVQDYGRIALLLIRKETAAPCLTVCNGPKNHQVCSRH
jgi:hypothetical protein